jgi:hypothetical protein
MENALVVAATAGGEIELFKRHGVGGTSLTLLGRWERRGKISWELASLLVGMLQAMVGQLEGGGIDVVDASLRIADAGLCAVGFERTYK